MAGTTGLEPATSAVTGQRSNQLSYVPRRIRCSLHHIREEGRWRDSRLVRTFLFEVCSDNGESFGLVRLQTFYRNDFSILSDREIFGGACCCLGMSERERSIGCSMKVSVGDRRGGVLMTCEEEKGG